MRHLFSLFYLRKNFQSPYFSYFRNGLWAICFLFLFSGCMRSDPWVHKVDSEEAMRTVLLYAAGLEHDRRLYLEDSFITYNNQIHKFHLEFRTQEVLDVRAARELLVDTVEGFLESVNANFVLRSELFELPFTADNLEIMIFPQVFYGKYVDERDVGLIVLKNGIACFLAWDSFDDSKDFWHSRSEYYFQSRDTVKYQREGEALYQKAVRKTGKRALEEEQYFPYAEAPFQPSY